MTDSRIPIIRLWNRMLIPLQGEITDDTARVLCDEVLASLHSEPAEGLVLDLTGLSLLDSHLCYVLSRLAMAAKLMGTPTILSGMNAHTAHTLETMGVSLGHIGKSASAEDALEKLGVQAQLGGPVVKLIKHRRARGNVIRG